jgi:glutathione S-transferase
MAVAPEEGRDEVVLYGHWICPYSVRVEFDLVRLGRGYRLVEVPPSGVRPPSFVLPEEFVAHSPLLEIPMIHDADGYLADSLPILEHLDPSATEEARRMARWVDALAFPPMVGVYYARSDEEAGVAALALSAAMDELARVLAPTGWLSGEGPSMAEAALVPLYVRLDGLRRLGFAEALPDVVERHAAACLALEAGCAVTWSPAQTDEFVARLSERRRS